MQNLTIPKVSDTLNEQIEQDITLDEIAFALKQLPYNKSLGSDGLPTEFYKCFWKNIKSVVFNSFKYAFDTKDQKRGIITLVPQKDKDIRHLKNWRPTSLLNTDYKFLTKLLAIRLQKVIPDIISPDQVRYIKGFLLEILSD